MSPSLAVLPVIQTVTITVGRAGGAIRGGLAMGFRDMDLDDQVRAAIRRDQHLSSLRIDVRVRNGIVYLTGAVNASARDQAIRLVRGVESVAAVVDQLSVP